MTKPPKKTAAEKKGEYRRGTQKKTAKGPSARGAAARAANEKRGVPSVAKPKAPRERSVRDAASREQPETNAADVRSARPVRDRSETGSSKRRPKPQRSIDAPPSKAGGTVKAEREGLYYGQCSKLCGKDHAYMPIAVRVVSEQKYLAWVEEAKKKFAAAPSPNDFADNAAIRQ